MNGCELLLQRLQELLYEESRNLYSSLPIIRHRRLKKIVMDAELDLDEDELLQVHSHLHQFKNRRLLNLLLRVMCLYQPHFHKVAQISLSLF